MEHRTLGVRKGWPSARVQDSVKALGKHREENKGWRETQKARWMILKRNFTEAELRIWPALQQGKLG